LHVKENCELEQVPTDAPEDFEGENPREIPAGASGTSGLGCNGLCHKLIHGKEFGRIAETNPEKNGASAILRGRGGVQMQAVQRNSAFHGGIDGIQVKPVSLQCGRVEKSAVSGAAQRQVSPEVDGLEVGVSMRCLTVTPWPGRGRNFAGPGWQRPGSDYQSVYQGAITR
jgi:hypothetical protein